MLVLFRDTDSDDANLTPMKKPVSKVSLRPTGHWFYFHEFLVFRCVLARACGGEANHHLCSSIQLNILLRAEKYARSLPHSWIDLPRRVIR